MIETIRISGETSPQGEVNFHVWQDDNDKWWSCRSGVYNGLYSESDDLGPFDSRQEALDAQKENLKDYYA